MLIETVASIAIAAIIANSALSILNTQRRQSRATAAAQACVSTAHGGPISIQGVNPEEVTSAPDSVVDRMQASSYYVYRNVNMPSEECRRVLEINLKAGIRAVGVGPDDSIVLEVENGEVKGSGKVSSLWLEKA